MAKAVNSRSWHSLGWAAVETRQHRAACCPPVGSRRSGRALLGIFCADFLYASAFKKSARGSRPGGAKPFGHLTQDEARAALDTFNDVRGLERRFARGA